MKIAFLAVFFVLSFHTFQYFPGMPLVQEGWNAVCSIFLLTIYPAWIVTRPGRLSKLEFYVLVLVLFIPLASAIGAWRVFGQPIILGILSQRDASLLSAALMLTFALQRRIVTVQEVEKTLLWLAWVTFFVFFAMRTLLRPDNFIVYGKGLVETVSDGGYVFKLQGYFITFGLFYYAFLGFKKREIKFYLFALVFFAFLLGETGGRAMSISVIVTLLFFSYRWSKKERFAKFIPKLLIIISVVLMAAFQVAPDSFNQRLEKFQNAFEVAFYGREVADVSATARIHETQLALPYIEKNLWFGNGNISYQWNGGYEGVFGYFYPADIGLVGVVYMFGVTGLLLFSCQYIFAMRIASGVPRGVHSPLLDATKGFLLYSAVFSITTGFFVHNIEINLLFICLLWFLSKKIRASVLSLGIRNTEIHKRRG